MKVVLFLLGVGAAIYALLILSNDALTEGNADRYAGQMQPNDPVATRLNSWGSYLSDASPSRSQPGASRQVASSAPQQRRNTNQNLDGNPGDAYRLALSEERAKAAGKDDAKPAAVEWVKVALDADAHSEASLSSPSVRFYPSGAKLQVLKREGAWSEVSDPSTQQRSWILEKYLSSNVSPGAAQIAAETPSQPLAEPARRRSAIRSRSAKSVSRVSAVSADPWSRRWARRDRRRFGLFMFSSP